MSIGLDNALRDSLGKNGGVAGQSPEFGGKIICQGIGSKTIQDTVNEGSLVKSIVPGGELDGVKNIQTLDVRGIQDANYQTVPTLQHDALGTNTGQRGQGH